MSELCLGHMLILKPDLGQHSEHHEWLGQGKCFTIVLGQKKLRGTWTKNRERVVPEENQNIITLKQQMLGSKKQKQTKKQYFLSNVSFKPI